MVDRQERYAITSIANALIASIFLFYFYIISRVNFFHSIGFIILGISFSFKALADYLYSKFGKEEEEVRRRFHLYSSIHYFIAGISLLIFKYFGIIHSMFLGILSLIFGYFEYLHSSVLEDEVYRVRRHLMSILFKWYLGSVIFFDAFLYHFVDLTIKGIVFSIIGTLVGIYILYAAIITYRYIRDTSRISIKDAIINVVGNRITNI
ncbi:MAG: hypothetical protein QXW13_00320 [Nanopusillaceae archaeon]